MSRCSFENPRSGESCLRTSSPSSRMTGKPSSANRCESAPAMVDLPAPERPVKNTVIPWLVRPRGLVGMGLLRSGSAVTMKARVHRGGHTGDVEPASEKLIDPVCHVSRAHHGVGVGNVQDVEAGATGQKAFDVTQVCLVSVGDFPVLEGTRRLSPHRQHAVLGCHDLVQGPMQQDHTIVVGCRKMGQQKRDHLDRLAACGPKPRRVQAFVELFDPLKLEVAVRVALVGRSRPVAHHTHAAGRKHSHGHRCAGPGESGHDNNRLPKSNRPVSTEKSPRHLRTFSAIAAALLLLIASPAEAYIGPGAGFALLSSFFVLFTTIVIVLVSLIAWPFRAL